MALIQEMLSKMYVTLYGNVSDDMMNIEAEGSIDMQISKYLNIIYQHQKYSIMRYRRLSFGKKSFSSGGNLVK